MIPVWNRVRAYWTSGTLPQRPEGCYRVESLRTSRPQRRQEQRRVKSETCEFALSQSCDQDHILLEEGSAITVNMSQSGMQLLLGIAPRAGQLLEVHRGGRLRSVSIMEVCWAKPVRKDAQGPLYVVGCRLTFGPTFIRPSVNSFALRSL